MCGERNQRFPGKSIRVLFEERFADQMYPFDDSHFSTLALAFPA